MTQQLRIISDGTVAGTKVVDRHGREVQGVTSVSWSINLKTQESVATLTMECAPAYLEGKVETVGKKGAKQEVEA